MHKAKTENKYLFTHYGQFRDADQPTIHVFVLGGEAGLGNQEETPETWGQLENSGETSETWEK